jgi:hypothetical protein
VRVGGASSPCGGGMQSLVDGGVVKLIGICILCSMANCDPSKVGRFPSIHMHMHHAVPVMLT